MQEVHERARGQSVLVGSCGGVGAKCFLFRRLLGAEPFKTRSTFYGMTTFSRLPPCVFATCTK